LTSTRKKDSRCAAFIAIVLFAVIVIMFAWHYTKPTNACTSSGGVISTGICCNSVGDYPNTCLIGACGCGPGYNHQVRTCECPAGTCFNGASCVPGP
jgi:hypothetical protein